MKKLVIKINDVLIDVSKNHDRAIKKSIEFFLGTVVDMQEISKFRMNSCLANNFECINKFLNEKGLYLRESAMLKKFNEYFIGREFDGFINECTNLVDLKLLEKLSKQYEIVLIAAMPESEARFIVNKFKLGKYDIIYTDSSDKALRKISGNKLFLGSTMVDYESAKKNSIDFIGYCMDNPSIITIQKMEELLD